jgi:hypothetical protein
MSKNDKPFYSKHYEFATLYFYTEADFRFDLLITCPHAEMGTSFLEIDFPAISDLISIDKQSLYEFLSIEHDFGTHELAQAIAQKLFKEYGVSTLILEPSFPRSILDAGRLYPNCLRNIIDYDNHKDIKNELLNVYNDYMAKLVHVTAVAKNYNALAIDLHTMSSYSPNIIQERYSEAIREEPDNLMEYIGYYKNSNKDFEKRKTELFTGDSRNGIFASKELLQSLTAEILARRIPMDYDKPYVLAEHLVAHYLVCELGCVCIDIPKDLLSVTTTDDEGYDIANLVIDEAKIDSVAGMFARAVSAAKLNIIRGD